MSATPVQLSGPAAELGSDRPTSFGMASLEAAPADLLPQQPPAPAAVPPPATAHSPAARVQLGFRDGTSATLAPGSSQALALERLAMSLTRRD